MKEIIERTEITIKALEGAINESKDSESDHVRAKSKGYEFALKLIKIDLSFQKYMSDEK